MAINFKTTALALAFGAFAGGASAALLDLSGQGYYTYGNTNSYSLPILAYQYDLANGGGTGPGNPYYVTSTPGAIQDLVVIYTGSSGTGVTTNTAGFEDAYQTPNGSSPVYASTSGIGVVAPDQTVTATKGIASTLTTTWDASLTALKGFLGGGDAVFLFNNNDTNVDQNLAIWAKLWISEGTSTTAFNGRYLYLSNEGAIYGQGGQPMGDATTYNPGNVGPGFYGAGTTDYVLSGGGVTICKATGVTVTPSTPCAGATEVINHNLGANQAAYAGSMPLLNQWLSDLFKLSDPALAQFSLHLELNLGCDPAWINDQGNACDNFKIDNGFEQLFLASTKTDFIPEPAGLALFGLALAGLGVSRRRKA